MTNLTNQNLIFPVAQVGDCTLSLTQNRHTGKYTLDLEKKRETIIYVEGGKEIIDVWNQVSKMTNPQWIAAALKVPDYKPGKYDIRSQRNKNCLEFALANHRKLLLAGDDMLYCITGSWYQQTCEKIVLYWEDANFIRINAKKYSGKATTIWDDQKLIRAREGQEPIKYWLAISGVGLPTYNHPLVMEKAFKACYIKPFSE